jgi:hypothetical protein
MTRIPMDILNNLNITAWTDLILKNLDNNDFARVQPSSAAKFQRRHYEAIAEVLLASTSTMETIDKMADMFKADNARFNRDRFVAASSRDVYDTRLNRYERVTNK